MIAASPESCLGCVEELIKTELLVGDVNQTRTGNTIDIADESGKDHSKETLKACVNACKELANILLKFLFLI